MDPILVAALRSMLQLKGRATAAGETITPDDEEAFLRQETKGQYGRDDAMKYLGSIDTSINPRNLARSAVQGATMNTGDEALDQLTSDPVQSVLKKVAQPSVFAPAAVMAALGRYIRQEMGPHAGEDMRLRESLFRKEHPVADAVASTGGAVASSFALPGAAAAKTVGGAMLKGAGTGALIGTLSGAGEGEGAADRLQKAALGGVVGGTLGAVLPGTLAGVKALRDPMARAVARMSHAIDKSGGVDAVRQSVADMAAAGRGGEMMLGDASDHLRKAADFAATNSDDVMIPLAKTVKARQADASDRLINDTRDLLGGDPRADARKLELAGETQQWAAGPEGYGGIREANPAIDISEIATRLNKPGVKASWKLARLAGDIKEGDPVDNLMQKLSTANPGMSKAELEDAAKTIRSMAQNDAVKTGGPLSEDMNGPAGRAVSFEDMQAMKEILDDKASHAFANSKGALGNAYATVRDEVVGAMKASVPNYEAVAAKYAGRKGLERALEAGGDAWDQVDTRGLGAQIGQLTDKELEQFRYGMASRLITKLRSIGTNRDQAKQLMDASPAMEDKLKVVFGDKGTFDDFMKRVSAEADLAKMRGPISGSETARRLQAAGFDPAELGIDMAAHAASGHGGIARAVRTVAARAVKAAITRNTATQMGPMLMTQGAPAIDALLASWGQKAPLLGPFAARALPAAAAKIPSLFSSF